MKKRFLGFILSVLMITGTINQAVLNAKTTINPQDFINSTFRRPGDNVNLQPVDDDGNPVIKSFDKSKAYTLQTNYDLAQETTTEEKSSENLPEESTTEDLAKESTTEVIKDSTTLENFVTICRELSNQFDAKSEDFKIDVSLDYNIINEYRKSIGSEDSQKDGEVVQSMILESLFSWNKDENDEEQENYLINLLQTSSGLTEEEIQTNLSEWDISSLTQEIKDENIVDEHYYATLCYKPLYEKESNKESETSTSKEEETSEQKEPIKNDGDLKQEETSTSKKEETSEQKELIKNDGALKQDNTTQKDVYEQSAQEEVPFNEQSEIDGVIVHVKAPKGSFPSGSTLHVEKINSKSVNRKLTNAIDSSTENIVKSYAYDIEIRDKDGKEIEPDISKGQVKVSFSMKEVKNNNLSIEAYHVDDTMQANTLATKIKDDTISVNTAEFSYYVINFGYDTKSYEICSGEEVNLKDILRSVGISGTVTAATSSSDKITVRHDSDDWYVKTVEDFNQAENIMVTIDDLQYKISVTSSSDYNNFAILFSDGTLAFINKDRDLTKLIQQHGEISHKYVVSEVGSKHDWTNNATEIKHVIFLDNLSPVSTNSWFNGCSNLIDVSGEEKLDMSKVTDMAAMFYGCSSLKTLDVSDWDTSSVTQMSVVFSGCSLIQFINFDNWDISNVKYLSGLCSGCISLKSINLSNWEVVNLQSFDSGFAGCSSLESANISNWKCHNTSIFGVSNLFNGCTKLHILDMNNWQISKQNSFNYFFVANFTNNIHLLELNAKDWQLDSAYDLSNMFTAVGNPKDGLVINLGTWKIPNATNLSNMFLSCNAKNIIMRDWDFSNVKNMSSMFNGCTYLESIDLSTWDLHNVENIGYMFLSCSHLQTIDFSKCKVTGLKYFPSVMFYGCTSLTSVNLDNFDLSKIDTNSSGFFGGFFSGCTNLTKINMNYWKLPRMSLSYFFVPMSLTYSDTPIEFNVKDWDLGVNTSLNAMFASFQASIINLGHWKISNVYNFSGMFQHCYAKQINFETWDTSYITDMSYMFQGCSNLKSLDLREWNMSNVRNIACMFNNCSSLLFLGVAKWNLSNIYSYSNFEMCFADCDSLTALDLSYWDLHNVNDPIFNALGVLSCSNLVILKIEHMNLSSVQFAGMVFSTTNTTSSSIRYLYADYLNLSRLTDINGFCSGMPFSHIYMNHLEIPLVSSAYSIFYGCSNLEFVEINAPNLHNSPGIEGSSGIFGNCVKLKNVSMNKWKFYTSDGANYPSHKAGFLTNMFNGCNALEILNMDECSFYNLKTTSNFSTISGLNTLQNLRYFSMSRCSFPDAISFSEMFKDCSNVEQIEILNTNAPKILSCSQMYAGCNNLKNIKFGHDSSGFYNLATTVAMFKNCFKLETINLYIPSAPIRNTSYMFDGCESIILINLDCLNMSNVTDISNMFRDCKSLETFNPVVFNTQNVYDMSHLFDGCESLKSVNTNKLNTALVENMAYMFRNCKSLLQIDVNSFDTESLQSLVGMFENCTNLSLVSISDFKVTNIKVFDKIFYGCKNLVYLDLSNWCTKSATSMKKFLIDSGIHRLKLGKYFEFYKETDILPYVKWMNVDTKKVYTLWSEYTGGEMSGVYVAEDYAVELNKDNVDDISYNQDTNKITIYTDSEEGQTPTIISFLDLFARKLKLSADLVNTNEELKSTLTKNFDKTNLSLTLKNRTYADIVGCSKQEKVIWTFDIPKNNKSVIRMDLLKDKTENVGYIQNSKEDLDKFVLYDKDGKIIEELKPNMQHTYKDLGYVGSYDTTEIDKDGNEKVVHHDSTYYGGDIGNMTDSKLDNKIYPEYSAYLSYDSSMNNYEVLLAPGHYEIDSSLAEFTDISLIPSELDGKTSAKIENGKPVKDAEGNIVTELVPNMYIYFSDIDLTSEESVSAFTLFNKIYEKTRNEYTIGSVERQIFKKVDKYGHGLPNALYKFTSLSTGFYFTAYTDSNGEISHDTENIGEMFKVEEVAAPSGYTVNTENLTIIFIKDVKNSQQISSNSVIYADASTTPTIQNNMCYTCQKYLQCTCKDFGNSDCDCCGLPTTKYNTSTEYVTQEDESVGDAYLEKLSDTYTNEYDRKSTGFNFRIIDVTENRYFIYNSIKIGDRVNLNSFLIDGHTYTIMEESYWQANVGKSAIYPNTSEMNLEKTWTSASQVIISKGYTKISTISGSNTITFTYNSNFNYKIEFTNHHNIFKHNLTVSKTVDSAIHDKVDTSKEFNFTLSLKNITLDLSDYDITYEKSDGTTGKVTLDQSGNFKFTLKHSQTIEFKDIPDITDYQITEEKNYNYHVEKTNDEGRLLGKDVEVTFKNTEVNPGSIKLIKKDGGSLLKGVTFSLAKEDGTVISSKTTDSKGEVLFSELESGTYTITETNTVKGHSLLTEPFTVTVPYAVKKTQADKDNMDVTDAVLIGNTYYYYNLTYVVKNEGVLDLPMTGAKKESYLLITLAIASVLFAQYYFIVVSHKRRKN